MKEETKLLEQIDPFNEEIQTALKMVYKMGEEKEKSKHKGFVYKLNGVLRYHREGLFPPSLLIKLLEEAIKQEEKEVGIAG